MPTGARVQGELRKMASDAMGRLIKSDDEVSDALESALQVIARKHRTADMSLEERIEMGLELEGKLPTFRRSMEKSELQQFSTPIPVAEAVHYAADVKPGETIREGSAGTGSLLEPFQHDVVTIKAIELDPRRADVLKALGYDVVNDDTFKVKAKADVAVGNPPFRGEGKKGGTKVAWQGPWGRMGDAGNRFTNWDLMLIPNGGRVVNVVAPGVVNMTNQSNKAFRDWLMKNHTVRAMVTLPPQAYESRGSKFHTDTGGAGLIVFDKGKIDNAPEPIIGQPSSWEEFIELIKPLSNGGSHSRIMGGVKSSGQRIPVQPELDGGKTQTQTPTGTGVGSKSPSQPGSRSGDTPGMQSDGVGVGGSGGNQTVGNAEPGRKPRGTDSGRSPVSTGTGENTAGVGTPNSGNLPSDNSRNDGGRSPGERLPKRQSSDAGVPKTNEAKSKPSVDIDVSDFSPYVPDDWRSISHPAPLLEPSGLSLVKGPDLKKEMPDWSPHPALLKGGKYKISNAQLQVAALGRYNMLQNRGMILADKMGVGKTISIVALAGDGYLSGEVPRQIIVANKRGHS